MEDNVILRTNGVEVSNFLTYSIDADLYQAEHQFMFHVVNPGVQIRRAQLCEVFVNGKRELKGTIDRVSKMYGEDRPVQYIIEGRDLMGILIDAYCEEFITIQGMTCKTLAERLIASLPFIRRQDVAYQENVRGGLKHKAKGPKGGATSQAWLGLGPVGKTDTAQSLGQIQPGKKVFEVLKEFAASRGLLFHSMPDGTFVFGKPVTSGPTAISLILRKGGAGAENNIIQGSSIDDISKRYSKITVVSQQQGQDAFGSTGEAAAPKISPHYVLTDPDFPKDFYKPYVAVGDHDERGPALQAEMLRDKMRYEGMKLGYVVKGHTQNGGNYGINVMARVVDELAEIDGKPVDGSWVVYGRRFFQDESGGRYTELRLGPPGGLIE